MRLGWLQDPETEVLGGAELTCRQLLAKLPRTVEVLPMPPGQVSIGVDAYVVHNCTSYGAGVIPALSTAPVLKFNHDVWPHGDPELRWWLTHRAALVVWLSPLQRRHFPRDVTSPQEFMPPAMDLAPFRDANHPGPRQDRTVWIGQMTGTHKGIAEAMAWARDNGPVDFYGEGPLRPQEGPGAPNVRSMGQVPYREVPALLARYKRFLHIPTGIEAFGRTVVEADAAGCEVITNDNVGARWWMQNRPGDLESGAEMFWGAVASLPAGPP